MDPWPHASPELRDYFYKLLKDGKYSDLTIITKGVSFPAHKVVVCSRSDFLDKACGKSSNGSFCDQIAFPDDPLVVRALIDYLYTGEYNNVAEYPDYEVPAFPGKDHMELDRFWQQTWFHIQLYLLADRLKLDKLKEKTLDSHEGWMGDMLMDSPEDFPVFIFLLIDLVYRSTARHNIALRESTTGYIAHNLNAIDIGKLKPLLLEIPELSYDMNIALIGRPQAA